MIEFLKVAALLMTIVSVTMLAISIIVPSLRQSKSFHFLCGESLFLTTIVFGCLAVGDTGSFAGPMFFVVFGIGSAKFAQAIWLATK